MTPYNSHGRSRLWRCFERILSDIRHYMTMFTRFVRRVFGIGISESRRPIDCDRDINECESQSSATGSDTSTSVVSVSNLNLTSYPKDIYRIECTVDVHTIDKSAPPNMPQIVKREPSQPLNETIDDTTLSALVNLDVNDQTTRDVREQCERLVLENTYLKDFTDDELTERVRALFGECMLVIEKQCELAREAVGESKSENEKTSVDVYNSTAEKASESDKISGQCLFPKRHVDDSNIPLLAQDQFALSAGTPSFLPSTTNHQGLSAMAATSSGDADNELDNGKSFPEKDIHSNVDELSNRECCPSIQEHDSVLNTVRDVFDFKATGPLLLKTKPLKSEQVTLSSSWKFNSPPVKKSKTQPADSPHPENTAKNMVLTNAPPSEIFRETAKNIFDIQNDLHTKQRKKIKPSLQTTDTTETKLPKDPSASSYVDSLSYCEQKVVTLRHKYTYTLETYDTLSKYRIIKSTSGLLNTAYVDMRISAVGDQWFLEESMLNKSVQTDRDSHLEPHFDLACLFANNQQGFLYETSSGFERAAYRMDGQIAPQQGRRGRKIQKQENKKVKRRGIPNKHLAPKEQSYVPSDKGNGEEENMLEPEVQKEEDVKPDVVGKQGNGDSPRLDLRHFEVVPIEVVQKKKMEDDIEIQYAVDVGQRRKTKNKKKQCKTPVKGNKDCEEIRNMILGCNTTRRSGDNVWGRRHSGDL